MSLRRVTTTVIAVALACSLAPGGRAEAAADPTTAASDSSVVVATYNVRHALSDDVAAADVERLAATGVDVIGLQEMGDGGRRTALRARMVSCAGCEFGAYMPTGPGPAEVPILYRTSELELVSSGQQLISPATYVGPDGAGPSTMAPKYLTWVQLRHRLTGQLMYVVNNHTVPSVQAAGGGPNLAHPERLELYRKHMAALSAMVAEFRATGAAVFTTGDFNVDYRRDSVLQSPLFPFQQMKRLGVYASFRSLGMPSTGTHVLDSGNDTRVIDYVSALEHPAVVPEAQEILTGYRSDHRPVTASYAIAVAPGAPSAVSARAGERSATVSWRPAADNGRPVQSYTVTAVETGAEVVVGGGVSRVVVPGLVAGDSVTFTVEATNLVGSGPPSLPSRAVTPTAVPPETSITAGPAPDSFVTSSAAQLRWASSASGSTYSCTLDGAQRPCPTAALSLSGLARTTHTFTVTARDAAGDVDPSPASRTWTVPLGASDLSRTARWSLREDRGSYTGRFVTTTRKSAALTTQVSGARALALVAGKGRGHGTVRVYLGSTLLKTVSLGAASQSRARVLPVARFATAKTGQVRIVVASSGKPVRIEGLGVSTR